MIKYVYVVTNVEDGWDCVRGVYTTEELAKDYLRQCGVSEEEIENDESTYIIHKETLNDK